MEEILFPAEWHKQSAIQLTWPHKDTDWADMLEEVTQCFINIAREIIKHEYLIIICPDIEMVKKQLGTIDLSRIIFREMETNDTWARDHGGISVMNGSSMCVLDFVFNGWGMKFAANWDNLITRRMFHSGIFNKEVNLASMQPFVLEGGSIESDGEGTLMTTEECLLSLNRNDFLPKEQIEEDLKETFGVKRILWISSGYLAGDDTDSHIDTLARFCSKETIAYVQCNDPEDEHYDELKQMEEDLKSFRTIDNKPYNLIALPMAPKVEWQSERLPATYANFLIINGAVLMPSYHSDLDQVAATQLSKAFPDREIVTIDCNALIKQHGSLHCVTMQYPEGFVKINKSAL